MPKGPKERPFTIYLAGPMSGHDNYNFDAFHEAARKLREAGVVVMSPAETAGQIKVMPRSWYFRFDFAVIANVDAVVVLPGWSDSGGAKAEVIYATEVGVPVYAYDDYHFSLPIGSRIRVHDWEVGWSLCGMDVGERANIRSKLRPDAEIGPAVKAFPDPPASTDTDAYRAGYAQGRDDARSDLLSRLEGSSV